MRKGTLGKIGENRALILAVSVTGADKLRIAWRFTWDVMQIFLHEASFTKIELDKR